ncbi:E3 ubiquitin-protein ligase UHRF1-like [Mizuhopecten yessoensis]|uniref:E3 ubiquitin-protein ligase UHRF1-like n=1 Tax=Mizuhopecten yessoensis TaxID=6573 RepID=UPI000B4591AB|nr:E3 ubiquitin-protein ligase UHRF1-like [Mizuhopecten yessoensis]
MWIQVRSFDGKVSMQVDNLSKLTKIEDLRERLIEKFNAPADRQRLFYRGKQLADGHSLFDYNVGLNDLIQILVRQDVPSEKAKPTVNGYNSGGEESSASDKENKRPVTPETVVATTSSEETGEDLKSTYKIGDIIDARDISVGAWFEAKIVKVVVDTGKKAERVAEPNNNEDPQSGAEPNNNDKPLSGKLTESSATTGSSQDNKDTDSGANSMEIDGGSEIIDKVKTEKNFEEIDNLNDGFIYHVVFEGYEDTDAEELACERIRPRAKTVFKLSEIKEGQKVMINYNVDDPDQRGFWYDAIVTKKQDTRTIKKLLATVFIGPDLMPLDDCDILFLNEIFGIEIAGTQLNVEDVAKDPSQSPVKRQNKPECSHCMDNPRRKCKHCACCVCGGKNDPDKQILCDECDQAYHLQCMNPALDSIPEDDEWYCPDCKTDSDAIVKAGEKLKESKKKSRMASSTNSTSRDWGRGMACVGRQNVCTVVPANHFGSIPGIEVGTLWKFRVQVSEDGVHRPHVAGIHGREDAGAFSIVLSGGYEDDKDDGEQFTYTGSGGRDLSGNKRTAEQSCDQVLTRTNKALAKNCNATIDNKKGACSEEWKKGKPVRVVRNCKGRKHSKYAPEEGNRYDGIYKISKYWPEKGKSGFLVWRYLFKRDDPTPAPWTKAGKKRIEELGLEMQYPAGYLEAMAKKEEEEETSSGAAGKKRKGKRKRTDSDSSSGGTPEKKQKVAKYTINPAQKKLIKQDEINKKLWEDAMLLTKEGGQKFLGKVEELFNCICCQEVVFKPVTTVCNHTICKPCLTRSFKAEVYNCPMCRTDLKQEEDELKVNKTLQTILQNFFPGYEAGR